MRIHDGLLSNHKEDEILSFGPTWTELGDIVLGENKPDKDRQIPNFLSFVETDHIEVAKKIEIIRW